MIAQRTIETREHSCLWIQQPVQNADMQMIEDRKQMKKIFDLAYFTVSFNLLHGGPNQKAFVFIRVLIVQPFFQTLAVVFDCVFRNV